MALSCGPKLLIADEPTTALDVTMQAQVLELIVDLQRQFGMAMILITHDLGVVAESCSRAIVMYCGSVIENAPIEQIFGQPRHPYTVGLLGSIPRIGQKIDDETGGKLPVIPGMVPDLLHLPSGCRFAERCSKVQDLCRTSRPPLTSDDNESWVACYVPN